MSANTIYYTVYRTINTINNKEYIGVHATKNPNDSYLGSGKNLKKAIEKYGETSFKKEILHIFDNSDDMYNMEKMLVDSLYVSREDTYNIKEGGLGTQKGFKFSDEIRKLQSETRKGKDNGMYGRKHSKEVIEKLSQRVGENNPFYDKKHNEAHIEKLKTHNVMFDPEIKQKHRLAVTNEDYKEKLREAKRNAPLLTCPHCGKTAKNFIIKRDHLDKCKNKQEPL